MNENIKLTNDNVRLIQNAILESAAKSLMPPDELAASLIKAFKIVSEA